MIRYGVDGRPLELVINELKVKKDSIKVVLKKDVIKHG